MRTINKIDIFQCGNAAMNVGNGDGCGGGGGGGDGDLSESERKKLLAFMRIYCLLVVKRQHFNCNRYNEENLLDFCTDEQFPIRYVGMDEERKNVDAPAETGG